MLKQYDLMKGLIWVTLLAIFDQLLFFITFQLASGGSVKIALGEGILWPVLLYPVVLKAISFFLVVQAIVYGALIGVVWFCCQQLRAVFPWFEKRLYWMGTLLWTIAFIAFFIGNIIYFPNSFFSLWLTRSPGYYVDTFPKLAAVWAALVVLCGAVLAWSMARFFYCSWRKPWLVKTLGVLFVVLSVKGGFAAYEKHEKAGSAAKVTQPNIIIIGLDALRPDHLDINRTSPQYLTPHLDSFLKQAVVFNETLTPLARTFPAWMSILTGKYPLYHGARFNLDAPQLLKTDYTLPQVLQQQGYQTWFATDETRFSNIEADLGFEHLVKPPEGANDFLLGTLNDFPITNFLVNSWLGEKLFPYSYANRAAFVTYRPVTFVKRVGKLLPDQAHLNKPLFLSMHLLLSHWPNEWANSSFNYKTLLTDRYKGSVHEIDAQWGALMAMLKEKKLLDNAIVVVLSDHGESLGIPGDKLLTEKFHQPGADPLKRIERYRYVTAPPESLRFDKDYGIDTSYGHGTDVLSMSQYQTLLAWQRMGGEAWEPKRITQRTSLLDIMPTLLDLMNVSVPAKIKLDGVSLKQNLLHGNVTLAQRDLYLEDGYKIPALQTDKISVQEVLQQSMHAYDIDRRTGKITMKPDLERRGLQAKEYAIMRGRWMVAYYPPYKEGDWIKMLQSKIKSIRSGELCPPPQHGRWFVIDLETKKWSSDLKAAWSKQTPAQELKKKLIAFYGNEIHDR